MPAHLRPTAPIAADTILPGDPKRAMELATRLIERPLMSNLSRGLWGYHGVRADGRELTVQSTGIGGPSAAVVLVELAQLGVRRAIRLGTCRALDPELSPGDSIVAEAALASDGVGSELASDEGSVTADPELAAALAEVLPAARVGVVASTDLYYGRDPARARAWSAAGALAVDLSAAAVLAVGRRSGVEVGCALLVAESASGERLGDAELDEAALALGAEAARALGAPRQAPEAASSS
jgi:uridine phosphorylase